jgi:hypothetical protein
MNLAGEMVLYNLFLPIVGFLNRNDMLKLKCLDKKNNEKITKLYKNKQWVETREKIFINTLREQGWLSVNHISKITKFTPIYNKIDGINRVIEIIGVGNGPIPSSICDLEYLEKIVSIKYKAGYRAFVKIPFKLQKYLNKMNITGKLPFEMGLLANLKSMGLKHNRIVSYIPNSFGNLKKLDDIYLVGNVILGEIPQSMFVIDGPLSRPYSVTNIWERALHGHKYVYKGPIQELIEKHRHSPFVIMDEELDDPNDFDSYTSMPLLVRQNAMCDYAGEEEIQMDDYVQNLIKYI